MARPDTMGLGPAHHFFLIQMSLPTISSRDSSEGSSLLLGLQTGNETAWERLIEIYAPLVRSWCQIAGLPDAAIPDVVQEVFLAVHRRVADFRPQPGSTGFRGWLWTITRNHVRDYYRQRPVRGAGGSTAALMLHDLPDTAIVEEDPSEPMQVSSLLHRALQYVRCEFQESTWTAFWRTTVEGQRTADVAADLGVTAAAVRQARSRVLRRLREQLGDAR